MPVLISVLASIVGRPRHHGWVYLVCADLALLPPSLFLLFVEWLFLRVNISFAGFYSELVRRTPMSGTRLRRNVEY